MQQQSNPELFKALVKALPLPFLQGMARAIPAIYAEAHAEVNGSAVIGEAEAATLLPHFRRAILETRIRQEAANSGLAATVRKTKNDTASFSLLTFGQFMLTASHVADPGRRVRAAAFRSEHSALNEVLSQVDMFGFGEQSSAEQKIYCILLHGGDVREGNVTTFMEFAFPSPTDSSYVDSYPFDEVLAAAYGLTVDQAYVQTDKAFPVLKQQPKEGTSNGGLQ